MSLYRIMSRVSRTSDHDPRRGDEREIAHARDQYVSGAITLDEFEAAVDRALEREPLLDGLTLY